MAQSSGTVRWLGGDPVMPKHPNGKPRDRHGRSKHDEAVGAIISDLATISGAMRQPETEIATRRDAEAVGVAFPILNYPVAWRI